MIVFAFARGRRPIDGHTRLPGQVWAWRSGLAALESAIAARIVRPMIGPATPCSWSSCGLAFVSPGAMRMHVVHDHGQLDREYRDAGKF